MDFWLILLVLCFAVNLYGLIMGGGFLSLIFVGLSGYFLYERFK